MSQDLKKKKGKTHFKQKKISLSLFVYLHLWVTVYLGLATACFSSSHHYLNTKNAFLPLFFFCLFVLLKCLKPSIVVRREEHSRAGETVLRSRAVLPSPSRQESSCLQDSTRVSLVLLPNLPHGQCSF